MRQLLYNAQIINEGKRFIGYLEISEYGTIAKIGTGEVPAGLLSTYSENSIDLKGEWLLPGVIDSHVHFREPGGVHKATIYSESRAAVAGGVTSYMEMPNTNPSTTSLEALADKFKRAAKDSVANYSFYIGATKDNIDILKATDYTRVPGVKLFMGSSTGGMLVEGEDTLSEIFKLPALVAVHCEDEATIRANTEAVKRLYGDTEPGVEWHPQIRNVLSCCISTAHAINLAKHFNTRLHIMHLTTKQEVDMLSAAPEKVTGEVCVAHLLFDDRDYSCLGTRIKCNPSVKSVLHREALREAVRRGIVSTISTDHAPHTLEEKSHGLFGSPSGMPMVQYSLPAMLDLALKGEWSVETVVDRMCHRQAETFGIEKRGYIREGYAADLVQVDPQGCTIVTAASVLSKCGWSPLEGKRLRSRVMRTWVNGKQIYGAVTGISEENVNAQPLSFRRK